MLIMAGNLITLAFANDHEISAFGFVNTSEAVSYYSEAATSGFTQCRFVAYGLTDLVSGVDDDDYVMVVTGVTQLRAYITTFSDRPLNIRGWILFSNCDYFLDELDLIFGQCGGYTVPVDQYMCGADGRPVLQAGEWEFTDYFGDDVNIVISGVTYTKAWDVERLDVPYTQQNLTSIVRIVYCSIHEHSLADGTTLKVAKPPKIRKGVTLSEPYAALYKEIGSPFVTNGTKLTEVIPQPTFFHAYVKCVCGREQWAVGAWDGYTSTCCGKTCRPIALATPRAEPGSVIVTKANAGKGVKYYNNLFVKHIADVDDCGVWRIIKAQTKGDLASSGKLRMHEESCVLDPCHFRNYTKLATKFKYALLSGDFDDHICRAIVDGHLDVGSCVVDVTDRILGRPWFLRKLGALAERAWGLFLDALRALKVGSAHLLELAKALACSTVTVANSAISLACDVPAMFRSVVDALFANIVSVFNNTADALNIGGLSYPRFGAHVLFPSAIVELVRAKVRGKKQAGLGSVQYFKVVVGNTQKVQSSRVEVSTANLVVVDDDVQPPTKGYTTVIGGLAFFCSDGFYWPMVDADAVLLAPVYRAASDLKPIFDCAPIEGFPDVTGNNVAELCVNVDRVLQVYNTAYVTYSSVIKQERCHINCVYNFSAPAFYTDTVKFCDLCQKLKTHGGFPEFYKTAHEVTGMQEFVAICCTGDFSVFKPALLDCPDLLRSLDGGSIWTTFIVGVESATDFIKHLKVSYGVSGIVIVAAKKFRKLAATLAGLYNAFLNSVSSIVRLAGVGFTYLSTEVPRLILGANLYDVKSIRAEELAIPVESQVSKFNVIAGGTVAVQPQRVEVMSLEFEECDFVEPGVGGSLAIIDGYSFYHCGGYFYPSALDKAVPICYRKKGGSDVKFSEDVQVRTIDPVYRVRLEYEFEDGRIVDVFKRAVGSKLKVHDWDDLLCSIETAMSVLREHMNIPPYHVYDEEGGQDLTLPIMVSQWPLLNEDTDAHDNEVADAIATLDEVVDSVGGTSEVQEVEEALSFITETQSVVVKDPFAFSFTSYGGLKVLDQIQNNCWVASALVQLQLLGLAEDDAMKLFLAGRVGPMVKRCYESQGAIVGSLGDVSACMEHLLKGLDTLTVKCDVVCDCGCGDRIYTASTLRMTPTTDTFPYGVCPQCNQILLHTITSVKGSGVFCRDPTELDVDSLVVKPLCASAFRGDHYVTNLYACNMAVDGNGKHTIQWDTLDTICVKDADWVAPSPSVQPEPPVSSVSPFLTYKNIEFYQGEIADLIRVEHDFVVNAANEKLQHGGGVADAINRMTNGRLQVVSNAHVKANGSLKVGTGVMLTCADTKILNVVGPRRGKHAATLLVKAYDCVFSNDGVPLTPLLSVGIFGVPLTQSLSAFLACAGTRVCKCFCYTDDERVQIVDYIHSLQSESVSTVQPVVKPNPAPFRTEGTVAFYEADPASYSMLGVEKLVCFTTPKFQLCDALVAFDKHVGGAVSMALKAFVKQTPTCPAGNCVTLRCEGLPDVVLVVLPEAGAANSEQNHRRALSKFTKLKGNKLVLVNDSGLLAKLVHVPVIGFVTQRTVVDAVYECKTVVNTVTADDRTHKYIALDSSKTYGEQLGDCVVEGTVVTNHKPTETQSVVSVIPKADWDAHYGFQGAGAFHMADHTKYGFPNNVILGKRVLKTTDQNCWVNTVCLQLQFVGARFTSPGLQAAWESFCVGDVACFVHFVYWVTNVNHGEPSDAENALNMLAKYLEDSGSVTIERTTAEGCCSQRRTVTSPVVNASVLKTGVDDVNCSHGIQYVDRVASIKGRVILVNAGAPVVAEPSLFIDGLSYAVFIDNDVGPGHYTVMDRRVGMMFDGDTARPGDLAISPVTSVVVDNQQPIAKVVKDPVKTVEFNATKFLDGLNYASERFFSVGDFVSRNLLVVLIYVFSILSLCFRAFKKRDVKVLAGVPQRTGIIVTRSLRYNLKALRVCLNFKFRWLKLCAKFVLGMYTLYALFFMLIRFTYIGSPICADIVDGYANSSFDKNDYCDSVVCKMCLYGYDELSDLPHTKVVWRHFRDPLVLNVMPFVYLTFLTIFGGRYMRALVLYFILQYVNTLCVMLFVQEPLWFLQFVPFNVFCDEIVVCFVVTKVLLFVKHVLFGCDSPSCLACSKSAKLRRVPVQTIFQGSSKSFYVNANGGKKYCKKHNFFCVNCDSYGPGCTFINDVIASEVGNAVKLNVQPTGPASIDIDKVEFSNGFYYLYSGSTFWKYNFDITDSKYTCKEALKSCNINTDFIVYNNSGSNVTQVKNACVYLSQVLCKPIKLVDSALLSTLSVDFGSSIHSAFVRVLTNSFGKDLSGCGTLNECRTTLGFDDVSQQDFNQAVSEAHRYDILLTDLSFNNFTSSYAKPEEKFPVHDLAACMRVGAKVVNHNVLVKDNVPVVWLVKDFMCLSEETRKYIIRTCKVKGLTFMLTFNPCRMHTNVPTVCIASKKGAGSPGLFSRLYKVCWWFCVTVVALFIATSFIDFSSSVTSASDFDFKYIKDGVLTEFTEPLSCVHNVFDNFNEWHQSKFAVMPVNSKRCPIVVGVSDEARTVPGVPAGLYLVGRTLVFATNTVYGASGLCFDERGLASSGACLFNSACTVLSGIGGLATYCYKNGLVEGARLYSELQPHSFYKFSDGNAFAMPEVISRGFGFRSVRTRAMTYCRVGQCVQSREGVCFGFDRFLVFSANSGQDFVCGSGLWSLLLNVFNMFSQTVPVTVLSGQILFNCVVAFLAISICFMFTKFKRIFGDMSFGVFTVACCTLVNNVSYIATQNYMSLIIYAMLYFLCTNGTKYMWVWHLGFVISYVLVAPWWILVIYLISALMEFVPGILKYKISTQLFEGDKFVGSFESAASGTFVLDMYSYERLANSISSEKLKQYANSYNKYKYYSGNASEADYRLACFAHLARAMMDYATSRQDMLYTPPTISYNSSLQAGLRKMAQPSGIVERCIVRVAYGNTVLNGVWLGDTVICPRHVIATDTTKTIDYDQAMSLIRLHNFSVSVGSMYLGVIGVTMRGTVLHIKVNQDNVHTPKYTYRTLRSGESFNILACYDGVASGVFGVNMRTNYTVRGAFINGACGSPGYNVNGNVVEFCYLHQLELGSGCHVGSDFDGVMYGKYQDQPTLQIEGASNLVTENVLAFLYGALINGCSWWLSPNRVGIDSYNEWATQNGLTTVSNLDSLSMLAAKTNVEPNRVLSSIMSLKNFGGKKILGYTSLTDEFTVGEVVKQMFGVNLQSGKVSRALRNVLLIGSLLTLVWAELVSYTKFFWVNPGYVTPMFLLLACVSTATVFMVKHKLLFLQLFVLPTLFVCTGVNVATDFEVYDYLVKNFDYHMPLMGVNVGGLFNFGICCVVMLLHVYRFLRGNHSLFTFGVAIATSSYSYFVANDLLCSFMTFVSSLTGQWFIGAVAFKCATVMAQSLPNLVALFGWSKSVMVCYMTTGYIVCVYYGLLYWINRFFKLNCGVYDYYVSAAEFKYMVANGHRAPKGVLDSLLLSLRLVGIGGEKTIKVASVQSKLTDLKCANVVLMGCLTNMNVAANSGEWSYCVELHNKINLCNDPEKAQEMLLALLAFFLSKNSSFGLEDLLDSYFSDRSMLQSVAATYASLPSYVAYETARKNYEDALSNGSTPQLVKQLRHAMNVAKSEFDKDASVQRKIDRMAEQAAVQMYKEARAVNRKSKVISSMHSLLFGMLKRLDMSAVDTIMDLARDGVVPLAVIPAVSATKLNIVASDLESYNKIYREGCVHYAGAIWSIVDVKDNDGKPVHLKEIVAQNAETLAWPLFITCERIVKLQNNEIIPGKLKQRAVKAEGEGITGEGKALYNNESGKAFMYAFISDKPDLKVVRWEFDGGCNNIELEPPRKFLVESANGPVIKYLYFVRNLNNLRRGAVLGFIGATVRLQAGKQTEQAANSSLLTLCAFAADPARTYVDAVKSGQRPVGNCVKMLTNGSGNGMAITNGVEATTSQDSYGGASVCLYCRAHIEHPSIDGFCKLKGKYVQVPLGTLDPIRFVLENDVCKVCACWLANGCACDRTSLQSASMDSSYLNECGALVQLD
nr:MAG: polyprotein 1a [Pekapeka alphacoronavirus 1]